MGVAKSTPAQPPAPWTVNEMTIFYKATRPDGTDFYTGEVTP